MYCPETFAGALDVPTPAATTAGVALVMSPIMIVDAA
jgi:hypothetical protein